MNAGGRSKIDRHSSYDGRLEPQPLNGNLIQIQTFTAMRRVVDVLDTLKRVVRARRKQLPRPSRVVAAIHMHHNAADEAPGLWKGGSCYLKHWFEVDSLFMRAYGT